MVETVRAISLPDFGVLCLPLDYLRTLSAMELLEAARIVDRMESILSHDDPEENEAKCRAFVTLTDISTAAYELAAETPIDHLAKLEAQRLSIRTVDDPDNEETVTFLMSAMWAPPHEEIAEGIDPDFFSPLAAALLGIIARSPGIKFEATVLPLFREINEIDGTTFVEPQHSIEKVLNAAQHAFWAMSIGRLINGSTFHDGEPILGWNTELRLGGASK